MGRMGDWVFPLALWVKLTGRQMGKKEKDTSISLSQVLSRGFFQYPSLYDELPGLLSALDSGKQIVLSKFSPDPLQQVLVRILQLLPTSCTNDSVWKKENDCISLKKYVLSELLQSHSIIQPRQLSSDQNLSMKACKELIIIIQNNSTIVNDLISLLENVLEGEGIDLSGLENVSVKNDIKNLFSSLRIPQNEDGVYILDESDGVIRGAIEIVISAMKVGKIDLVPNQNSPSSQILTSQSGQENSSSVPIPRVGPSRPTPEQLQMAARVASGKQVLSESSDEEDDGPRPIDQAAYVQSESISVPLGGLPYTPALPEEPIQTLPKGKEPLQREEWLLTPGERKPFGEGMTAEMMTNRKFDRGKQSKKAAEVLAAESEKAYAAYLLSEEGQQTEAMLREFREKRGPSLVEQHRESSTKRPKVDNTMSQFFDRDRDLLSHRKMDRRQADQLIENAKQLDSRFSKTAVQKSFL